MNSDCECVSKGFCGVFDSQSSGPSSCTGCDRVLKVIFSLDITLIGFNGTRPGPRNPPRKNKSIIVELNVVLNGGKSVLVIWVKC